MGEGENRKAARVDGRSSHDCAISPNSVSLLISMFVSFNFMNKCDIQFVVLGS